MSMMLLTTWQQDLAELFVSHPYLSMRDRIKISLLVANTFDKDVTGWQAKLCIADINKSLEPMRW